MKYNQSAPSHYRRYWKLQDEQPKLEDMASSILLHYIQAWGQDNKKRLDTLAEVANKIGFVVEVVKHKKEHCFKFDNKKYPKFGEFVKEIREIRRGNFEGEVGQIARIVTKYFEMNKKWWQFRRKLN